MTVDQDRPPPRPLTSAPRAAPDDTSTVQRAWWTMGAAHLVMTGFWFLQAVAGAPWMLAEDGVLAAALIAALTVLQWRHSLAASRGSRPHGWHWSFGALLAIVVLPLWSIGPAWTTTVWAAVASTLMLLPRRAAIATVVGFGILVWPVAASITDLAARSAPQLVVDVGYFVVVHIGGGVALWASVELVRVLEQLHATRTSISEMAMARERFRQAADVHDLLGQNLTAIGLRATLGRRLGHRDPDAGRREARAIVDLAASALRDVRAAAHGDRTIHLRDEIDGSRDVLRAAAIDTTVLVEPLGLHAATETVMAWCVREAVTNVVRHADATWCTIHMRGTDAAIVLEVSNDGIEGRLEAGNGLRGIRSRARSIGGEATWSANGGIASVCVTIPSWSTSVTNVNLEA